MLVRILLGCLIMCLLLGCKWAEPEMVGLHDGKLHSCPDKRNCISTFADPESKHYIEPVKVIDDVSDDVMMNILKNFILSMPRTEIRQEKPDYIWALFKTRLGFVDDVEFYYDRPAGLLHIRSASRVGYYDFGVNSRRIHEIECMMKKDYDTVFDLTDLDCTQKRMKMPWQKD